MIMCLNLTMIVKQDPFWIQQTFQINPERGDHFCKQLESKLRNNEDTNFPELEYTVYCLESYTMDSLIHL